MIFFLPFFFFFYDTKSEFSLTREKKRPIAQISSYCYLLKQELQLLLLYSWKSFSPADPVYCKMSMPFLERVVIPV